MYQNSYQYKANKKDDNKGLKIVIIVLLALLLGASATIAFLFINNESIFAQEDDSMTFKVTEPIPETKENQEPVAYDGDYTEIVGYGEITIDEDTPCVYFSNVETNNVLLEFEVLDENGETIYVTPRIPPGERDSLNVLDQFSQGHHVLTYLITTYDMDTNRVLLSGIQQQQEINIIGG